MRQREEKRGKRGEKEIRRKSDPRRSNDVKRNTLYSTEYISSIQLLVKIAAEHIYQYVLYVFLFYSHQRCLANSSSS